MALFGLKKDKKPADKKEIAPKVVKAKPVKLAKVTKPIKDSKAPGQTGAIDIVSTSAYSILRPHITEKSGLLSQNGVYTFQVHSDATKQGVAAAIKALYKVTPVKVGIVNLPSKQVFLRGKKGHVAGMKKAMITVKKGEKIDFV